MMKKLLLLCTLIIQYHFSTAQDSLFSKVYSTNYGLLPHSSCLSFDDGLLLAGQSNEQDGLVIMLDSLGNNLWSKNYKCDQNNWPDFNIIDVIPTADSNYVLLGHTSSSAQNSAIVCLKIDPNGDVIWSKSMTGQTGESIEAVAVIENYDHSFVFVGNDLSLQKGFIAEIDSSGNFIHSNHLSSSFTEKITDLEQLQDSSYVILGNDQNTNECFVINIATDGQVNWAKRYVNIAGHRIKTNNNEIIIFGIDPTQNSSILLKLDSQGAVSWHNTYDFFSIYYNPEDVNLGFILLSDNSFLIAYSDHYMGLLMHVNSDGQPNSLSHLTLVANSVVETKNHNYFISGYGPLYGVKSLNHVHIGIIKTDSSFYQPNLCVWDSSFGSASPGSTTSSSVTYTLTNNLIEVSNTITSNDLTIQANLGCVDQYDGIDENDQQNEFEILPNFSSGIFQLENEHKENLRVTVYNSIGIEIFTKESASSTISIDLSSNSNGIYIYKIENRANQFSSGKLIITD